MINFKNKINHTREYKCAADIVDEIIYWLYTGQTIETVFIYISKYGMDLLFRNTLQEVMLYYFMGKDFNSTLQMLKGKYKNIFFAETIDTILVSQKMGTPLVDTLVSLSQRFKFFSQCQLDETCAKIPIKLIFPLVFFIFPVIFLLLGSGVIQDFLKTM